MKTLMAVRGLWLGWNTYAQDSLYVNGDKQFCEGDELTLFAGGDTSYYWINLKDSQDTLSKKSYLTLFLQIGDTIMLYGSTDSLIIPLFHKQSQCFCQVYVPNRFTPDGDLYNDVFQPVLYCTDAVGIRLTIYDRARNLVFDETNHYGPIWDGTEQHTGRPVSDGVYTFGL